MREMKDSGVEWIGKIPKDWEIVPLTKQLDSIVDYRGKTPEKTEEGTFLVTAKNIKDGKICYELSKEYVREADYEEIMHRGIPQIGDILFTTEPENIICLGLDTSVVVIRTLIDKKFSCNRVSELIGTGEPYIYGETYIYPVAHPGYWGTSTRGEDNVIADWRRIRK